jgi:antitoxin component YwqK of YwqJK toxin-antitoxin module
LKTVDLDDLEIDGCNYAFLDGERFTGTADEKWPDGSVRATQDYVDGMRHGKGREWSQTGQLLLEESFEYGGAEGLSRYWYENGQLKAERFNEYGFRVWHKEWDEAGNLIDDWRLTPDDPNYSSFVLRRDAELERQKPPR